MMPARSVIAAVIVLPSILGAIAIPSFVKTVNPSSPVPPVSTIKVEPVAPETVADSTGISFAQITSTFDSHLHFEPASPSEGMSRSKAVAQNEHHATMYVTGSQNDIHDAQLFVDMPSDSGDVTASNAGMVVQFAKNAMPGWSGAEKWVTHNGAYLLRQARHHASAPSTSIVRDNKRIVLALLVKPGVLAIGVKHE